MIRNLVLCRLASDASPEDEALLEEGLRGIAALDLPGLLDVRVGPDAGLRPGGWSAAIVNDWVDEDAYRAYDLDPGHGRFRAMVVRACADVARVQLRLGDADDGTAAAAPAADR